MNEWTTSPLDKLADITSGGTPSRAIPEYWDGNVPWVTPTDITSCPTNYLHDTKEKITSKGLAASSATLLPKGSLLFTSRATIGETKIAVGAVSTNQGFKSLSPKPNVDGLFLFYQVCRLKNEFIRFGAGSTFLEINRKDTGRVAIPHPVDPLVQKKIAAILQTADEAIEQTEALIEKYSLVKAGMMHDLFTRGLTPDGKLRPPREEAPDLYKETPIGWIPKEWSVASLGEHIGKIQSGWSPTCESDAAGPEDWAVLKTTAVVWNGYDELENKKLPKDLDGVPAIETKKDDILITRKGPRDRVGVVVWVPKTRNKLMFPDTVFRTRVEYPEVLLPEFLALSLQSATVQKHWDQRKIGLAEAQVNVNHGILRNTPFPMPCCKEQKRLLDRYNAAQDRLKSLSLDKKKLSVTKSGLMHDLLTGEVPVTVNDPEVAHV